MKTIAKDIDKTLAEFGKLYPRFDFVKSLNRVYQHNDLPNFYAYAAVLENSNKNTDGHIKKTIRASGTSFYSEDLALLKCLAETVERYSSTVYKNKNLLYGPYGKVKDAIDPSSFYYFSQSQLRQRRFKMFNFNAGTPFRWISATELLTNKKKFIPAQTVFYNYHFNDEEGRIIIPISTGAAAGRTMDEAIVRGILECVERDAFMISYLNKICRKKINLKSVSDNQIQDLVNMITKYRLELHLFDISTDINIPTYLSIIIDRTGHAPSVLVGAKCDFNDKEAIIGAIAESISVQSWFRELYFQGTIKKKIKYENINTTDERGIFWFNKAKIKNLDFWLNEKEKELKLENKKYSVKEKMRLLKEIFKEKNYPVYFADIGIPILREIDHKVLKVVIPDLQPLFLFEEYPFYGNKRLYEVPKRLGFVYKSEKELNKFPHPFL